MTTEVITVQTNSALLHCLDTLASSLDKPRDDLIESAIKSYLDLQAWQLEKVQAGIDAANQGHVIPHEHVMAEMDALIQEQIKRHESRV